MIDFILGYQYNREQCIRISFETTNNGLNQRIERTTNFLPSHSKREIGLLLWLNQRIERTTIFLPSQSKRAIGLLLWLNQRIERTTIFLSSQSKREIGLLLWYTLILTQRLWFEKNIYLFKANGYPVALRSAIDSNTTL